MTTLTSLGFDDFFASQFAELDAGWAPARIVAEGQSSFHVAGCRAPHADLSGRLLKTLDKLTRPVVGDWVAVVDGADRASIQQVLDRRTTLVRRAAGTKSEPQVVAANVDVFFVVTAANRDFNERRIERYVSAVWNSGADALKTKNMTKKVRKSKIELTGPKATMKFRTNEACNLYGCWMYVWSTLSVGRVS